MKTIILQPKNIVIPYEYQISDESILKMYFRVFDKGYGKDIPPVIVAKPKVGQDRTLIKRWYNKNADILYEQLDKLQTDVDNLYYLLDGNHRGIASTLCYNPIQALELEKDSDLDELDKLVKSGELFNVPMWPIELFGNQTTTKLSSIIVHFERGHIAVGKNVITLKQRVDKLILNNHLPEYMKRRYLNKK